ncbi:MAG: hypothetical protein GQ529_02025 [Methyloprofundus sp.]|nr:hypothetical protein [Methyloprofundus sp.]
MKRFAQAIEKQKWVPEVQMGAAAGSSAVDGGSRAMSLIDMLSVKTAKDLALDMSLPKTNTSNR